MELSNRLETIASFVTEGYVVADIGTDHGYIPIYLTSNGNCPRAYAMDVNKEPLSRAKTHIEEENAGEVVSCILSDGLHELPQDDVDSIVIAGMGGDLVVRILEQDFDKLANVKELILSPQSHLERVRHFLNNHGFRILEEEFLNRTDRPPRRNFRHPPDRSGGFRPRGTGELSRSLPAKASGPSVSVLGQQGLSRSGTRP